MSTQQVSRESIANIVATVQKYGRDEFRLDLQEAVTQTFLQIWDPERARMFQEAMINLNLKSYAARYREAFHGIELAKCLPYGKVLNDSQMLKSLDFYLYQCDEGGCDETLTYKTLNNLRRVLVSTMVRCSDGYKNAEWA